MKLDEARIVEEFSAAFRLAYPRNHYPAETNIRKLHYMAFVFQLSIECGDDEVLVGSVARHFESYSFAISEIVNATCSTRTITDAVGSKLYKVSLDALLQLELEGVIRMIDRPEAVRIMRESSDQNVSSDRFIKETIEIMSKNEEVLIEGQIPAQYIKRVN
jgi:hypothetical protein